MYLDADPELTRAALAGHVESYAGLARWYADRGDARRAVLATWAADVRALQHVLWENGLGTAPDAEQALGQVAEAVVSAVAASDAVDATGLREILERSRDAMTSAFDPSVHETLRGAYVDLDHLDSLPHGSSAGEANRSVADRLGGRSAEQLVGDLLATAHDARVVGQVMDEVGDHEEAQRQLGAACLAAFEAYLVLASAASGDATLATADLRWDLAAIKAAGTDGEPHRLREAMREVVVPAEEQALLELVDAPLPGPPLPGPTPPGPTPPGPTPPGAAG